jgi:hypothetical protein
MNIILTLSILLIQTHLFSQCECEVTFEFENTFKLEYPADEDDIIQKIEIDDARFYRSAYLRFGEDSIRLNGTWKICHFDSTSMEIMRAECFSAQLIQYPKFSFFGDSVEYFGNNKATYVQRTSVEFVVSDTVLTLTFHPASNKTCVYSYVVEYFDGAKLALRKTEPLEDCPKESVILQISRNAMTRE